MKPLIVIDGIDGCGKGTQIKLLADHLEDQNVMFTREPGGTEVGEVLRRELLTRRQQPLQPETQFHMFWASRVEHIVTRIVPHQRAGGLVISDRFDSSTFAFQIFGEDHLQLLDPFWSLRKLYVVFPVLYIFLVLSPKQAYERMSRDKARTMSNFDLKPIKYHKRVADAFGMFSKNVVEDGRDRAFRIDADSSVEDIHQNILDILKPYIRKEPA